MGILDGALSRLGYNKEQPTAVVKASNSGGIAGAFSSNNFGTGFTSLNNKKQQLESYQDWVYIAARTIAEQCASIDLRVFLNRTQMKSAMVGGKLMDNPAMAQKLLARKSNMIVYDAKKQQYVYRKEVPALEELEVHPLLDLLNCPNPFMTKNEFFEITFLHLELTGNAYWAVLNRDKKTKTPTELFPLLPSQMTIIPDKDKFIAGYIYRVNGQDVPFEIDDIIHHKYANPTDMREGYSAVQAGSRTIDTDAHMAEWNRKTMYNDARISGFLTTDTTLDDKVFKRVKSEFNETYGGSDNAYKIALLEGGMDFKQMSLTPKDMDFQTARNFNRDQILALFGVPKSLVGYDESMSRANAETAEYVFTKSRIKPKMQRLCTRITEDLAIQFDKQVVLSFTDPVPEDKEYLLLESQAALGIGGSVPWVTINEERAKRGDPLVPNGDEMLIPSTFVALGKLLEDPEEQEQAADAQENTDGRKPSGSDDGLSSTADDDNANDDSNSGSGADSTTDNNTAADTASPAPAKQLKQVAARDYPTLYDGLDINFDDLGCIMLDTQTINVTEHVPNAANDLLHEQAGEHKMGAIAESEAHVTLLFGLLENGNAWKAKVDMLLDGWSAPTVTVQSIDSFDLGDSYAIVARLAQTPELIDGHERLTLLPHVNTFSEYTPHITLAYIVKDDAIRDKWVQSLSPRFTGASLTTKGINYGSQIDTAKTFVAPPFPKSLFSEAATGTNPKAKTAGEDDLATASTTADETPMLVSYGALDHYLTKRNQAAARFELEFNRASRSVFNEQKQEVLALINIGYKGQALNTLNKRQVKTALGDLFNKAASLAQWSSVLVPVYQAANSTGAKLALDVTANPNKYGYSDGDGSSSSSDTSKYDPWSASIKQYFTDRAGNLSKDFDGETDKQLRATLTEGITAGEDRQNLLDRVEQIYGAANSWRADRIARTESQFALNYAATSAWDETGLIASYIWLTSVNPCPRCLNMQHRVEKHATDYSIGAPPAHPNCACTVTPYQFKSGGIMSDITPNTSAA